MERKSASGHKRSGSHFSKSNSTPKKTKKQSGKRKKSNKSPRDETDRMCPASNNEIGLDNSTRNSPNVADMPVDREDEYNMQHKKRGYAIIFNHYVYERKLDPREGTEHDVEELKTTFSTLGFKVIVYDDRSLNEIRRIISRFSLRVDHSDNDCLAVIVMTHGNSDGQLAPFEGNIAYDIDILWEAFTPDKCPSLAGKPKLFFIQACRGDKMNRGTIMKNKKSSKSEECDISPPSSRFPTTPDFLIAYSTVQDFGSKRIPCYGTWFIQDLCEELNTQDNLLQILVKTNRRVALRPPSGPDKEKQMPLISTTLIRDLYFHPK